MKKIIIKELQYGSLLENLLKEDIKPEDFEFLQMVKQKTPDLYSKFISIYKKYGIDFVKNEFKKYDPDLLKQKEREKKSLETKQNRLEKTKEMKMFIPSTNEVKDAIERTILTHDFRELSQILLLPQLSKETLSKKITTLNMREIGLEYEIFSIKRFNTIEQLFKEKEKNENPTTDDILDDIIKSKKFNKQNKKTVSAFKKFDDYYDEMEDLFDSSLRFKSFLNIRLFISKYQTRTVCHVKSSFGFDMTAGPSFPENIITLNSNLNEEVKTSEDVKYLIVNSLVKLSSKINQDLLLNSVKTYLGK